MFFASVFAEIKAHLPNASQVTLFLFFVTLHLQECCQLFNHLFIPGSFLDSGFCGVETVILGKENNSHEIEEVTAAFRLLDLFLIKLRGKKVAKWTFESLKKTVFTVYEDTLVVNHLLIALEQGTLSDKAFDVGRALKWFDDAELFVVKKSVSIVDGVDRETVINGNSQRTVELGHLKVVSERELRVLPQSNANRLKKLMFFLVAVHLDVTLWL